MIGTFEIQNGIAAEDFISHDFFQGNKQHTHKHYACNTISCIGKFMTIQIAGNKNEQLFIC